MIYKDLTIKEVKTDLWAPVKELVKAYPFLAYTTLKQYASRGKLPIDVYKIGGRLYVRQSDIARVDNMTTTTL